MKKLRVMIRNLIIILIIAIVVVFTALHSVFPVRYEAYILAAAKQHNISPYLILAIIKAESNFREKAQSHKDAKGLMQVTDPTAEFIADKLSVSEYDVHNPETNITFGAYYIKYLIGLYDGDLRLALYAYNAGMGNVNKWLKESGDSISLETSPFKETESYYKKVLWFKSVYEKLHPGME